MTCSIRGYLAKAHDACVERFAVRRAGYLGNVYRRSTTDEVIVAHRSTDENFQQGCCDAPLSDPLRSARWSYLLSQLTFFCLTALLMTACNGSEPASGRDLTSAKVDVAAGGRGLATLNPTPVKAYQVTLRIHRAPGTFKHVRGSAQYDVVNEEQCGHIEPASGTASRITSQEPLELKRISDDEYQGTLYLDRMQDQDYYGHGVCRWEFTGAGALLKATGAQEETRFLTFVDAPELVAGKTYTRHYPQDDYPRVGPIEGRPDLSIPDDFASRGEIDPHIFIPKLQDRLFSISVSAVAAQP